MQEIF